MDDLAWHYPAVILVAVALGVYVFVWLTRDERKPLPEDFARTCLRCKLRTVGKAAHDFLYCPFCAAKYPPEA